MSKLVDLKNIYNFKNPIRHFINVDNVIYPDNIADLTTNELSWTEPIRFRIRKGENDFRTLKFPNFLNFCSLYLKIRDESNFLSIDKIDDHKRMNPNITTGDFKSNSYSINLENDFELLCIYDNLIKVDIKSFYGRLYLHDLSLGSFETYVGNLNNGKSNELLLGNYVSLFIAETFLKKISDELTLTFKDRNVDCKFSYFSDDFYFFCNEENNLDVIKIFSEVLEKYELEINNDKTEYWNYEDYSDMNLVEKYWKKIVSEDRVKVKSTPNDKPLLFGFINQLIYRKSKLFNCKLKKVFINNFFKSTYFNQLEWNRYELQDFSCHQLFSLFKFSPEILLYTIEKFKVFDNFKIKIHDFLKIRFKKALQQNYYEEQLYYYYAIKSLEYNDILLENKELVYDSTNQVLKSYYIFDNYFNDVLEYLLIEDEKLWFVNYHCLLKLSLYREIDDSEIKKYLLPNYANKISQQDTYLEFYKENIQNNVWFINNYVEIKESVSDYIKKKIEERQNDNIANIDEGTFDDEEIFEFNYEG